MQQKLKFNNISSKSCVCLLITGFGNMLWKTLEPVFLKRGNLGNTQF